MAASAFLISPNTKTGGGDMIAIYARVSTQEQAAEGYSIDEQIERLRKYCEAQGRADIKPYVDGGYTGANMNRPSLKALIDDVKKGKIDKVVVYKLDRLSRSQKDTLHLIEDVFIKNGAEFESMSERFDTASSFGRAIIGILSVFAQLEREQIKERMSMGKEGRAKEGRWHGGGYTPAGYDYINGELIINEYEALQIREIFQRYTGGESVREIEAELIAKGKETKNGRWHARAITRVLENPLYIGQLRYKGETAAGRHDPIIDEETFEEAQKRLASVRGSQTTGAKNKTLLSGLVFCGRCGARYACSVHGGNGQNRNKYKYYACYSRRKISRGMIKDPTCKNTTYRQDRLDAIILDELKKLELNKNIIDSMIKAHRTPETENTVETLKAEIKRQEEAQAKLLDLYSMEGINKEILSDRIQAANRRIKAINEQIDEARQNSPKMSAEEAHNVLYNFSDIIKRGKIEEIRLVIEALIEKIEIDGENVTIHWRFI